MMNERSWSELCIFLIVVSLILYSIYIFTPRRGLKQLGFFGGSIFIAASILVFFIAKHKYELTRTSNTAIITSAVVTVTGSPNVKGTKLFILHEGTKVNITDNDGDWTEIQIANGNVGWLSGKNLSPI